MQTISTKYIAPTNNKGGRIKATNCSNNSITVDWNHSLEAIENHLTAIRVFKIKLNWDGEMVAGSTKEGMCAVFTNDHKV